MLQRAAPSCAIDDILSALAEQLPSLLSVTCCQIGLLEGHGERLTIRAAHTIRDISWSPSVGGELELDAVPKLRRIVNTGQPLVLSSEDARGRAAVARATPLMDQDLRSLAFVPLATGQRVLGLISLGEMRSWGRSPITARKLDICTAITLQAAMAVETAMELYASQEDLRAVLTHELRAPLGNLKLAANAALSYTQHSKQVETLLRTVNLQCDRLGAIIDLLLDSGRGESPPLEASLQPVNVAEVLARVVGLYTGFACSHPIHTQVECEDLLALADEEYLMVILCNLLDNAIKYSPEGGLISIDVDEYDEDRVVISVTDQGVGIPAEHLDRIFEKFHRVQADQMSPVDGQGLGLYIVKKLLEAQNGRIWVESRPGLGASFTLTLPRFGTGDCQTDPHGLDEARQIEHGSTKVENTLTLSGSRPTVLAVESEPNFAFRSRPTRLG